jgi:hypothetical protein
MRQEQETNLIPIRRAPNRSAIAALACLTVAGAAWAVTPPAQIAVSPSRFELEIGSKPTTESVNLMNLSDQDVMIQVTTVSWDLDEANQIRILEPDEQSLDQWMVINPLRFSIPAGKSQTVRFSIRPRVEPEPGEHRAMIYFNQVLPESTKNRVLRVRFNVGVAVYGLAGDATRSGKLNEVRVVEGSNPLILRFDVSSEGLAHVRLNGQYAIYPAESYPGVEQTTLLADNLHTDTSLPESVLVAGYLPARPVLPDTRRDVLLQVPRELPPGDYVLDLNGELPGQTIDLAVPFTVPDPTLVAGSDSD